jgi:hypothetical protein
VPRSVDDPVVRGVDIDSPRPSGTASARRGNRAPSRGGMGTTARRADRDRLRILLLTYYELIADNAARTKRLRELLLASGEPTDRALARSHLSDPRVAGLATRAPARTSASQRNRRAAIRDHAQQLHDHRAALETNRAQLRVMVNTLAPHLTQQPGIGIVKAAQTILDTAAP